MVLGTLRQQGELGLLGLLGPRDRLGPQGLLMVRLRP